ncbi:hypothetical protein Ciccas_010251 [Cichlidogyrus casuarinus]|uniref:Uncharacterized protein n=1 Tax=Cichlidogyrus casuarinus TaxID=1844966 RepID=A0ABD2PVQ9_9PLAT
MNSFEQRTIRANAIAKEALKMRLQRDSRCSSSLLNSTLTTSQLIHKADRKNVAIKAEFSPGKLGIRLEPLLDNVPYTEHKNEQEFRDLCKGILAKDDVDNEEELKQRAYIICLMRQGYQPEFLKNYKNARHKSFINQREFATTGQSIVTIDQQAKNPKNTFISDSSLNL